MASYMYEGMVRRLRQRDMELPSYTYEGESEESELAREDGLIHV